MNPVFFGSSPTQLFGAYDAPATHSRRGVVLCAPFAREYLLSHPSFRYLARQLAQNGWHAFRFDYLGTGDSAGDESDASVEQWAADTGQAIDELKDMQEVSEIALVGLRLGATVAAATAGRRSDVKRVVLWDPIIDGSGYLRELLGTAVPRASGVLEAKGVLLRESLRRDIAAIAPATFGTSLPATLVVNSLASDNAYASLVQHLSAAGIQVTQENAPDVAVWEAEWGRAGAGMPVQAMSRIITWLS